MQKYSPFILRIAIASVFIWFGSQQLLHTAQWLKMMPGWTSMIPLEVATLVKINGYFEIIFGLLLMIGFYTRFVSIVLTIHLFHIVYIVGYGGIGVRDFGLALASLAIVLNGKDIYCLDTYLENRKFLA